MRNDRPVLLGYARVSTKAQDTAAQRAALKRAGVRQIVEERRSGVATRPELDKLLATLQPGHVLVVYKIDRLARSLADLLRILDQVRDAGASFRSLTEPIDTTTPVGTLVVQMLGAIAQLERSMILERCAAGREEARLRGVQFGSPVRYPMAEILRLAESGHSRGAIARKLGASKSTISRALAGQRKAEGGPGEKAYRAGRRRSPGLGSQRSLGSMNSPTTIE